MTHVITAVTGMILGVPQLCFIRTPVCSQTRISVPGLQILQATAHRGRRV